jgi:hypothetical protein
MTKSGAQLTSSRTRRLVLAGVTLVLVLGTAEAVCRVYFAALIGRSVLFYGTPFERIAVTTDEQSPLLRNLRHRRMSGVGNRNNSVRNTDNKLVDYAKYYPHQQRSTYDIDTGEVYPGTINGRGFRGPDCAEEKRPGVVRVVTLGASSTFGYHARDELTYPAQLQRILNATCPGKTFEVINLGIPHLTSTQILALFVAEGAPLDPDVVTFYDSTMPARSRAIAMATRRCVRTRAHRSAGSIGVRYAAASCWLRSATRTHRYSAAQIGAHTEKSRQTLLENLDKLVRMSEELGFTPIIAAQQSRSLEVPREKIRGVTFRQEHDIVAGDLARQGWLGRKEAAFFVHGALLEAEEDWARVRGVSFVDVRSALDARRDLVVSWVHLNHEGNRIVAEQLAPAIHRRTCVDGDDSRAVASRSSE